MPIDKILTVKLGDTSKASAARQSLHAQLSPENFVLGVLLFVKRDENSTSSRVDFCLLMI